MLALMLLVVAMPITQLIVDHVGPEDRPVPKLILYELGSQKIQPLPAECREAALCFPVAGAAWREMTAAAQTAIAARTNAPHGPRRLGTFRFRLIAGKERTLGPPESGKLLLRLAGLAADADLRRELTRRAALGH